MCGRPKRSKERQRKRKNKTKQKAWKLNMDKVNKTVCLYALLGGFCRFHFQLMHLWSSSQEFWSREWLQCLGLYWWVQHNAVSWLINDFIKLLLTLTNMLIYIFLSECAEKSLNTMAKTIYHGFLIMAIRFLHYLISRCCKATAPYTMMMPFWVAFTLSVSYMSGFSLSWV